MAKHLLSFDLYADFACFKKPDINGKQGSPPVHRYLSYNMIHKPAILGIFGATVGLKGYKGKGELPEYYQAFKNLLIGIEPIENRHEKGNFSKTAIVYTNGTGFASEEQGGVLGVEEQTLIRPGYRCYVLLEDTVEQQARLYERLQNGESVYLPYLGKNEFPAWWSDVSVKEYTYSQFANSSDFKIASLFVRQYPLLHQRVSPKFSPSLRTMTNASSFMYFERLPLGFDETLFQYELAEFVFTDWTLMGDSVIDNLFYIEADGQKKVIQLF